MKSLIAIALLAVSASSFADWSEVANCSISRVAVETGTKVSGKVSGIIRVAGPDNGETGALTLKSSLIPSYEILVEKISGGRTSETVLTTKIGKTIFAKTSVDDQVSSSVQNKFVTANGDHQVTINCKTSI